MIDININTVGTSTNELKQKLELAMKKAFETPTWHFERSITRLRWIQIQNHDCRNNNKSRSSRSINTSIMIYPYKPYPYHSISILMLKTLLPIVRPNFP